MVVTFPAYPAVGTFTCQNEIVAGTSEQVLVACEAAELSSSAEEAILARPAKQVVAARQRVELVGAALAYEVIVPIGPPQSVRTIGADLVGRPGYPTGHDQRHGHHRQHKDEPSHPLCSFPRDGYATHPASLLRRWHHTPRVDGGISPK